MGQSKSPRLTKTPLLTVTMFRLALAISFVVAASAAGFRCGAGGPETDFPSTDGYNYCADDNACPCGKCCYCECEVPDTSEAPDTSGSPVVEVPDTSEAPDTSGDSPSPCDICVTNGVAFGMCGFLADGSITLELLIATAPPEAGCDTCDHSLFWDACPGVNAPTDAGTGVDAFTDAAEPAWVLGVGSDGVLYRCNAAVGTKFCRGNRDPQRNSFEMMNFPEDVSHWNSVDTDFEATVTGGKWTVDASKVLHFTADDNTDYKFMITTRDVRRML